MFACVLHTPNTRHLHFRVFSPVHYPCGTCRYGISRGKFRNGDGACLSLHLIPFMSDLLWATFNERPFMSDLLWANARSARASLLVIRFSPVSQVRSLTKKGHDDDSNFISHGEIHALRRLDSSEEPFTPRHHGTSTARTKFARI